MNKFLTIDKVPMYGICEFNGQRIVKLKTDSHGVYVAFWPYDVNFGLTFMDSAAAQNTLCNYTGCKVVEQIEIENNAIKSIKPNEFKIIEET